jgi:hypothetical protein
MGQSLMTGVSLKNESDFFQSEERHDSKKEVDPILFRKKFT